MQVAWEQKIATRCDPKTPSFQSTWSEKGALWTGALRLGVMGLLAHVVVLRHGDMVLFLTQVLLKRDH